MKRTLQVLVALSVVAMFLVTPVAAATSQGLEWGFVISDEFEFQLTSTEDGWNEEMYMNITSMPALAISDPVTDWSQIPDPHVGMWWANGTSVGFIALIFLGLLVLGSKIAVPIGNFSLLDDLVAAELTEEDTIDETNVWGVSWSSSINATHENRLSATYAKADGFLAEYKIELLISSSDTVLESLEVVRPNIPSVGIDTGNILQLLQDNILYIAIGVGVLLILAIVCKKR